MRIVGKKDLILTELIKKTDDKTIYDLDIKKFSKKRTLDENAKYWVLLNELASILNVSNEELHTRMIKDYSQPIPIKLPKAIIPENIGIKYYDRFKEEDNSIIWLVHKGSHEMNTKEFKRLLDGLISECEEVGIKIDN